MREYSAVSARFWTGTTGRKLRTGEDAPEAVIVSLYLLTSPHANMLGLYYLPKTFIAHETPLSIEGASKGLRRAIEEGFCAYDEENECVFVYEMASWQIDESLKPEDKRVPNVQKQFNLLPKTPLLKDFFERYQGPFHLENTRGIEGASKPPRSQEQEQEQEQDKKNKDPSSPGGDAKPVPACPHDSIIALYHEILPHAPKVRIWNEARKRYLTTRWREDKTRQNLDWWKKLFTYVAKSDFLCGRVTPSGSRTGQAPFVANLEWIIKPSNIVKIIEGNYENRGPA